jgi:hypothetical protein
MDDALEDLMARQGLSPAQKDEVRAEAKHWDANHLGRCSIDAKGEGLELF